MTDEDLASRLKSLAIQLRNCVGDHLKLLKLADSLDAEAADILDPPATEPVSQKEAEAIANYDALIARGHDPAITRPVEIEPEPKTIDGEPSDPTAEPLLITDETTKERI